MDPSEAWAKDEKRETEEHRKTKNCWEDEKGKLPRPQQRQQRQQVEQCGEEEESGPSLQDVKRALCQNFRDTGVVDDVTVRTALLLLYILHGVTSVGRELLYCSCSPVRYLTPFLPLESRPACSSGCGVWARACNIFALVVTCVCMDVHTLHAAHVALAVTFSLHRYKYHTSRLDCHSVRECKDRL